MMDLWSHDDCKNCCIFINIGQILMRQDSYRIYMNRSFQCRNCGVKWTVGCQVIVFVTTNGMMWWNCIRMMIARMIVSSSISTGFDDQTFGSRLQGYIFLLTPTLQDETEQWLLSYSSSYIVQSFLFFHCFPQQVQSGLLCIQSKRAEVSTDFIHEDSSSAYWLYQIPIYPISKNLAVIISLTLW
jgi:hypothetical protein